MDWPRTTYGCSPSLDAREPLSAKSFKDGLKKIQGFEFFGDVSGHFVVPSFTIGLACYRGAEAPNPKKCSGRCLGSAGRKWGARESAPESARESACKGARESARPPSLVLKEEDEHFPEHPCKHLPEHSLEHFPEHPTSGRHSAPSTSPSTFWGLGLRHLCSRQGQS